MENFIFYPAAAISVIATLLVVLGRKPVYAVLNLVVSLGGVALVFTTLGAPFLALVEMIVYAGAIVVLFLFVVMMLNLGKNPDDEDLRRPSWKQLAVPGLLTLVLLVLTVASLSAGTAQAAGALVQSPRDLGLALFSRHYLGVKIAGLILLIGTVGGIHIGRGASVADTKEKPLDASV